jgi:hypothetical protein
LISVFKRLRERPFNLKVASSLAKGYDSGRPLVRALIFHWLRLPVTRIQSEDVLQGAHVIDEM